MRQQMSHQRYIKKSKTIIDTAKPTSFTETTKWDDWQPTFRNFLKGIPGRNGVPLSYVIRHNENPDPTPNGDFLENYIAMAPLHGDAFITDNTEVHTYITSFIAGNTTAEAKALPFAHTNNGRATYMALVEHYEGVGHQALDLLKADRDLSTLFILVKRNHTCGGQNSKHGSKQPMRYTTSMKDVKSIPKDNDSVIYSTWSKQISLMLSKHLLLPK